MKIKIFSFLLILALLFIWGCEPRINGKENNESPTLRFEQIRFYSNLNFTKQRKPSQLRLTYYFDNGYPHRWMVLDSSGKLMTDYIYEYNDAWLETGARYVEDGETEYAIELVRFENDSTKITEWIDSTGNVYYTMVDNLNAQGKTYRATFIGDTIHGYDSTFYNAQGFEKRIFFTNNKGRIFNDRRFVYDSVNEFKDWVIRKKFMGDTISEIQFRELHYDGYFTDRNGVFYPGVITTADWDENVISFTDDEKIVFFTRTKDWTNQFGFLATKANGAYTPAEKIPGLDSIYNGALSPSGNRIIFNKKNNGIDENWLLEKVNGYWKEPIKISNKARNTGGYFYWFDENELYFHIPENNGDIAQGILNEDEITITNALALINSGEATEFSPYVDRKKRFMIFTRYLEGDASQQGFFISYNQKDFEEPEWSEPQKITSLPYGWNPYITLDYQRFIFTDGENIRSFPLKKLGLAIDL